MVDQELIEIIKSGKETRNIEYKQSIPWSNHENREKLIRTIFAMSNIRDGGFIVIGMRKQSDNSYIPAGIAGTDKATYNEDHMADVISEFADPYVNFALATAQIDDKEFLIIQINEFEEIPVICKKDGSTTNLKRGKIYIRSRRKPESIEIPSQSEMRELLEVATDKGIRKFFARVEKVGIEFKTIDEKQLFADQIKDLE